MNFREFLVSKAFKKITGLILLFSLLFSTQVLIRIYFKDGIYESSSVLPDMGMALFILIMIFTGDWVSKKIFPSKDPEKEK